MNTKIHSIPLGFGQCYLLQGDGIIMIDGGAPNKINSFIKNMNRISINPEDIQLIILTHGHWDHIASAADIKSITGAKIVMHRNEQEWLERSLKPLPPAVTRWGRIFNKIEGLFMPLIHIPAANVDIVLDDNDFSLHEYGIPGKVIYTPGHSSGSISVLLESEVVFVGDLAMNKLPLCFNPGLPIFAEDMKQVKESWKLLLAPGIETIYPAHGKPFSANVIRNILSNSNEVDYS